MVGPIEQKVIRYQSLTASCLDQSCKSIDKDAAMIQNWLKECIDSHTILESDIEFSFSMAKTFPIHPIHVENESVMQREVKETNATVTYASLYRKYDIMTFQQVRDECLRSHLSCSGSFRDCIDRLVAHDAKRLGVSPPNSAAVLSPHIKTISRRVEPNTASIRMNERVPKASPSTVSTKWASGLSANQASSSAPVNQVKSIQFDTISQFCIIETHQSHIIQTYQSRIL